MVDGKHQTLFAGALDHAVAIGRGFRHGLFDEDVTAHVESFQNQASVRGRRSEDVNHVGPGGGHGLKGRVNAGDSKLRGQSLGAGFVGVGDADDLHKGEAAQGAGVISTHVTGSHEPHPYFVVRLHFAPKRSVRGSTLRLRSTTAHGRRAGARGRARGSRDRSRRYGNRRRGRHRYRASGRRS